MKRTQEIVIGNHVIRRGGDPFIIAEIGVNYYDIAEKEKLSLLDAAKLMIAKAGAGRNRPRTGRVYSNGGQQ